MSESASALEADIKSVGSSTVGRTSTSTSKLVLGEGEVVWYPSGSYASFGAAVGAVLASFVRFRSAARSSDFGFSLEHFREKK